jgi:hypothetical protein
MIFMSLLANIQEEGIFLKVLKINTESFHIVAHIEEENCFWLVIITLSFGSAR